MALTRRQIATILSICYLLGLTVLAGYASHSSDSYNLPIPNALNALTLALPPIAGLTIETSSALATSLSTNPKHRTTRNRTIPPVLLPSTLTIVALLIYTTVVATLAGTRIAPVGGLTCALRERWEEMFRAKDEDSIRKIQDSFKCCGLMTAKDMAYPFPAREVEANACEVTFGRHQGCFESWRGEERMVSAMMLVVAIGVFLWMVVIVAMPAVHPSSIRNTLQWQHGGVEDEGGEGTRSIEYGRYSDNPDAENQNVQHDAVSEEIAGLNNESQIASMVEGSRVHPSGLRQAEFADIDSNKWSGGRGRT